ncbi:hypothetical protein TTRE_0000384301 [Trichuris trichiura]|uniref:Uncharacterized protein n=1 Tax=Trichuris trichiura TaxID=36087 RepID=A0A077ZA25_TRITR|nr:hypothetical protein TTRE_0000384301 [Trichuris trichiura]
MKLPVRSGTTEVLESERSRGNGPKLNIGSTITCRPSIRKASQQLLYVVGNDSTKYLATKSCRKCYRTILPRKSEPHLQIVSFSSCENNSSLALVNVDSVFIPVSAAEQPQKQTKFISGEIAEQIPVNNGVVETPNCFTKCVTPRLMIHKNESRFHGANQPPIIHLNTMAVQAASSNNASPIASTVTCSHMQEKQTNEHEFTGLSDCFQKYQELSPCVDSCDMDTVNANYGIYDFENKQYDKPVAMAKKCVSDSNCNSGIFNPSEVSKFSVHVTENNSNGISYNAQNWGTTGTTSVHPIGLSPIVCSAERQHVTAHSLSTTHGSHHISSPVVHHSHDKLLDSSYSCDAPPKSISVLSSIEERAHAGASTSSLQVGHAAKSRPPCRYQALQTDMMDSQLDASAPWAKLNGEDESIISKEKKVENQKAWKGSEQLYAISMNGQKATRNATYSSLAVSGNTDSIAEATARSSDGDIQVSAESQCWNAQGPSQALFQSSLILQLVPSERTSHKTSCHRGSFADQTLVPCFPRKVARTMPLAVDIEPVACSNTQLHPALRTQNIDCLPAVACQNKTTDQWTHEPCELQTNGLPCLPLPHSAARSREATKCNMPNGYVSSCSYNKECSFALEQDKPRLAILKSKIAESENKFGTTGSSQRKSSRCIRKTASLQKMYFLLLKGIFLSPCVDPRLLVDTIVSTLSSENLRSFSKLFEEKMQEVRASAVPLALTSSKRSYGSRFEKQSDGCPNECAPDAQAKNGCPTTETVVPPKASCSSPSASNSTWKEFKQHMSKNKRKMLHKLLKYRIKAKRFFQTDIGTNAFHTLKDDQKEALEQLCCQMAQMVFSSPGSKTCLTESFLDSRKMKRSISKSRKRFQMDQPNDEADEAAILLEPTLPLKLNSSEHNPLAELKDGHGLNHVRLKIRLPFLPPMALTSVTPTDAEETFLYFEESILRGTTSVLWTSNSMISQELQDCKESMLGLAGHTIHYSGTEEQAEEAEFSRT